jgi:Flp pilus assembly protein TadD
LKSGTTNSGSQFPALRLLTEVWHERKALLGGIILFGLVLWTFLPAIDGEFVVYDDPDYVSANLQVQHGLTWENVKWAFSSFKAANWHPLTWLSHMVDCQIYGLAPWGHHLTSLLLHALNTLLAYVVFRRITGVTGRAFIVALLFGLHPLRVESVAWVAERKDVLSTAFWLLTLWAYAKYVETGAGQDPTPKLPAGGGGHRDRMTAETRTACTNASPKLAFRHVLPVGRLPWLYYGLALAFFVLGLMSKPMLVTVPCVMLLLDYWPLRRWPQRSARDLVLEKGPFFVVAILSSTATWAVQQRGGAIVAGLPLTARLENAVVAYCRYLGKLFCPIDLAAFYPPVGRWPGGTVLLACLLLLALSVMAITLRRRFPYCLMGWLWFLGTLVPVIGLVPAGEQSMADRYSYVPSIGIILAVVWGAYDLTKRWRYQAMAASIATVGAACLCLWLTRTQIGYWKDTETLFRHALLITQHNYVAHNNLGTALDKQERWDEALSEFRQALHAKPDYPEALNNLGVALDRQGHVEEAIAQLRQTLKLRPRYAVAHYNLGVALQEQGHLDEAIAQYQEALSLKPRYADAHCNLGLALQRKRDLDGAIAQFQAILKFQPNSPEVCNKLGVVLEQKGQLDEAIRLYFAALKLNPDYARAHFNLGVALGRKGQVDPAIAELEQSLKLEPDYAPAQTNLTRLRDLKRSLDK